MSRRQKVDPITLAVIEARLNSITLEMGIVMTKTARSPTFSHAHDFSCFLADARGRVIAQADGLPIHTGSGGFAVRGVLKFWGSDIADGDVFLLNDPYVAGGNHLPDWTLISPVFDKGQLIAFAANRAHQADIGGGVIGTYNIEATEIYHEGVRLPALKLIERGRIRADLLELLKINGRMPDAMESDLGAMLASTRTGARRILELIDDYGHAESQRQFEALFDIGERAMRRAIDAIPDGTYVGSDSMTNDCFERREVGVRVAITVSGSALKVDFTGTAPQIRGFKNSGLPNTHAAVYMALLTVLGPDIPRNEGTYRPISVVAPPGTVVNANPPAAVTFGTASPAHEIIHAIWRALAPVLPEAVSAGWGKTAHPLSASLEGDPDPYVFYHFSGFPGAGAVYGGDGFDQTGTLNTLGATTIPNLEAYEQLYPVRFRRHEFRQDGGGPGRWRGGAGVHYVVTFVAPSLLIWRGDGLYTPSGFGIAGGRAGKPAEATFKPPVEGIEQAQWGKFRVEAGTTMHLNSAGGGGYGDPLARDPNLVRRDVVDGLVSIESATVDYGVVLDSRTFQVDREGTLRSRERGESSAAPEL